MSTFRVGYNDTVDVGGGVGMNGLIQPDMMDFLSMMSGMSDYAVNPEYMRGGEFDYVTPRQRDTDMEINGHGSPIARS